MTITKEVLDELLSGVENANDLLGDKPRNAVEAMLITQMTATHVALTSLSQKMVDTSSGYQVREALERSMTRLSRTYLAQMDALKNTAPKHNRWSG